MFNNFITFYVILIILFININGLIVNSEKTGGANCTNIEDCNIGNIKENKCEKNITEIIGHCICTKKWAKPDCSYRRKSKVLAGRLQFLSIIGIGGIGNFIIGKIEFFMFEFMLTQIGFVGIFMSLLSFTKIFKNHFKVSNEYLSLQLCISVSIYVIGVLLSISDAIFFFQGRKLDGNNYALY